MTIGEVLQEIAALRREMRDAMRERVASVVRFGRISKQSADGKDDEQEGYPVSPSDQNGGYGYRSRRLWPFGIRSVPPTGVDSVAVQVLGGTTNTILVGAESSDYGPSNLDTGETALYSSAADAIIKIDKNGAIEGTAKAAQNVTITASTTGKVKLLATAVTGAVELGPNPIAQVLVVGSTDSFGVPVQQLPAAAASIVKSG